MGEVKGYIISPYQCVFDNIKILAPVSEFVLLEIAGHFAKLYNCPMYIMELEDFQTVRVLNVRVLTPEGRLYPSQKRFQEYYGNKEEK